MMESSAFDDQIFCDFAGPLSPPGVKPHSVQVMLGMPNGSPDLCNQRLPEVHSLLPGASKIDHYKNMDYKMGSYSPTAKYDYGKCDQYNGGGGAKLDYGKHMDYVGVIGGGKHHNEYSPPPQNMSLAPQSHQQHPKLDYDHHTIHMYQQSSQPQAGQQQQQLTDTSTVMNGGSDISGLTKKKAEDPNCTSAPTTTTTGGADATSGVVVTKKNDKKKVDPNGAKKKKTR